MNTDSQVHEINKIIETSCKFEEYMDSTDFDSYLPATEEDEDIKGSPGYERYVKNLENAQKEIDKGIRVAGSNEVLSLIYKAKSTRLEARCQTNRKKEQAKNVDALFELDKAFLKIDPKTLKQNAGSSIYENDNWVKLLLYNEMAVCYSSLEDTSISLGYAERSISLLKDIYSEIKFPEKAPRIVKLLYTFALYNKGEAERNLESLENHEDALIAFREIQRIYEKANIWRGKKPSDYYSATLKLAIILTDLGRGKEALKCIEKVKGIADEGDYRKQECMLEEARARIDMKDFEEASRILEHCRNESSLADTFSRRKATVTECRLLTEFKKNRAKDYKELRQEHNQLTSAFFQKIAYRFDSIEKDMLPFLEETVRRRDGDCFRKACLNYATYFQQDNALEKALILFVIPTSRQVF